MLLSKSIYDFVQYLSVKGEVMKKVSAMELLAVSLDHCDLVLWSLEHLSLVQSLQTCPGEVSLSGHIEGAVHTLQWYGLIWVSVLNQDYAIKSDTFETFPPWI